MDKKADKYDERANKAAEENWIREHLSDGKEYPFIDCEHCDTWVAFDDKCSCGKTWITYIGVEELGDGAYSLEVCGIPEHTVGRG